MNWFEWIMLVAALTVLIVLIVNEFIELIKGDDDSHE